MLWHSISARLSIINEWVNYTRSDKTVVRVSGAQRGLTTGQRKLYIFPSINQNKTE